MYNVLKPNLCEYDGGRDSTTPPIRINLLPPGRHSYPRLARYAMYANPVEGLRH